MTGCKRCYCIHQLLLNTEREGGGLEWINIGGKCLGNYVVFCSLPFFDTSLRLSFINHNKYRRLSSPNILGNLCHFVVHYHVPHFHSANPRYLLIFWHKLKKTQYLTTKSQTRDMGEPFYSKVSTERPLGGFLAMKWRLGVTYWALSVLIWNLRK